MVDQMVKLPPGYHLEWSGSYEGMQRAGERLMYVIPLTCPGHLRAAVLQHALADQSADRALGGAVFAARRFLLLDFLGYNMSVAVWVGIIALAGVDAETGVVMLLYLDLAYERRTPRKAA